LVYFVFIWYIISGFGIMYQEKSGNHAEQMKSFQWWRLIALAAWQSGYSILLKNRGQFFKTSVGANSRIGANSAECHHCIGASSPRRRENPFKKLASGDCGWYPTRASWNSHQKPIVCAFFSVL
jgi:hypothetical protein